MSYYQSVRLKKQDLPEEIAWDGRRKEITRPVQSGFDYDDWPIVRLSKGSPKLDMAHWEFIPFWINDKGELEQARQKYTTLDARGETLLSSRMFSKAARERRCLMVSSGFYEWRHYRGRPYPYFITVKGSDVFYIAAVWQPWIDRESGEHMITFALVTTRANDLMARVHNKRKRMPVILTESLAQEWMDKSLGEDRIKEIATFQFPADQMEAYTIRKDFREALDPKESFEYEELPPIRF